MDYLCSPWRGRYVIGGEREEGCVFCRLAAEGGDHEVLLRTGHWYVTLNAFPYTNGHLLLVAREHASGLRQLAPAALAELGPMLGRLERLLQRAYGPDGMNVGINFGAAGGAGIPDHLHIHLVPRWVGDTNFMSVVGNTRVLPEALGDSYARLRRVLGEMADEPEAEG